jgi:hypothetical protein
MFKLDSQNILIGAVIVTIIWFFNYILGSMLIIIAASVIGLFMFNWLGSIFRKDTTKPKDKAKDPTDLSGAFKETKP